MVMGDGCRRRFPMLLRSLGFLHFPWFRFIFPPLGRWLLESVTAEDFPGYYVVLVFLMSLYFSSFGRWLQEDFPGYSVVLVFFMSLYFSSFGRWLQEKTSQATMCSLGCLHFSLVFSRFFSFLEMTRREGFRCYYVVLVFLISVEFSLFFLFGRWLGETGRRLRFLHLSCFFWQVFTGGY